MIIAKNSVVAFHYEVTDADNQQVIDSSEGREPLTYLHGANNIIPGLEEALEGKKEGDALDVTIAPAKAYGERKNEQVQQVPKDAFANIDNLELGMTVTAQTPQGPVNLIVTEVEEATVTVDGNHPLAGRTLAFSVKVDSVRDASEEEISHGHVHGPGGHDH